MAVPIYHALDLLLQLGHSLISKAIIYHDGAMLFFAGVLVAHHALPNSRPLFELLDSANTPSMVVQLVELMIQALSILTGVCSSCGWDSLWYQ